MCRWFDSAPGHHISKSLIRQGFFVSGFGRCTKQVIHLFQGLIMLLASHLRRSRHGIYYFRIVLPDPIAAVLGQRELARSLGIRSPKLARQSGYQLSLQLTPILEGLQRIMAN